MSGRVPTIEISTLELESLAADVVQRRTKALASRALKRIRLSANPPCSQSALAKSVNRTKATIINWESTKKDLLPDPYLVPQILARLGVPKGIVKRSAVLLDQCDGDLDLRLYQRTDPDLVEEVFFRRTRGRVLSQLYDMCLKSDIRAIQTYLDLLQQNTAKTSGKKHRSVRRVSPNAALRFTPEPKNLAQSAKNEPGPEPSEPNGGSSVVNEPGLARSNLEPRQPGDIVKDQMNSTEVDEIDPIECGV